MVSLRAVLAEGDRSSLPQLANYPYLLRLATVECANNARSGQDVTKRRKLTPNSKCIARFREVGVKVTEDALGPRARLVQFLQLIDHLSTAPWASKRFEPNDTMVARLTASHMKLITWCERPPVQLYDLLSLPLDEAPYPQETLNYVWITNRQQGKTSTIAKFIAALALAAKPTAMLITVYSTKQDRAGELVNAAKRYYHWMQTDEGRHPKWPSITLRRDNERGFEVALSPTAAASGVFARPKNPDTCRGDAPSAAFFDEVAFMSASFWYQFALPLSQIAGRRFTCTTTPPPPKSYFDQFCNQVRTANADGDYFFGLINHSLACEQCIAARKATECCHRLHLVPQWKSMLSITSSLGKLMPRHRQAQFTQEVFGVMSNDGSAFLDPKLLDAVRKRVAVTSWTARCPTIWVGIDPPAHNKSDMGLAAFLVAPTSGQIVLIGAAAVESGATEVNEIQKTVDKWTTDLRAHPFAKLNSPIIPIVECNNNDILSRSIVNAITSQSGPTYMPFVKERFQRHFTHGVGVWTTAETKLAALSVVYQALLDGRISIASHICTINREIIDPRAQPPPDRTTIVNRLLDELGQFGFDQRGRVTGKQSEDSQDDLGMAFLLAMYWRVSVKAADPSVRD